MPSRVTRGRHSARRGQVLVPVLLVLAFVGVTMVAGTGDIAMAEHEHERADEAATLGALSGAQSPSLASIYGGAPSLAASTAVANCQAAVRAVAPEAILDPTTCVVDATDPLHRRLRVTVVIRFQLPIPVPFIAPVVQARRDSALAEGTVTPG